MTTEKMKDNFYCFCSRLRQRFNSYPGRPQLLKFHSLSLKDEAESKLDKFQAILEADLLNFKALKELSWSGVPRKVRKVIRPQI